MPNQPSGPNAGIHPAFNPTIAIHHAQMMQQAYHIGMQVGWVSGYQAGYTQGQADSSQYYFPVALQQNLQRRYTPYNIQPRSVVTTQQQRSVIQSVTMAQPGADINQPGPSGVQQPTPIAPPYYLRTHDRQYKCMYCNTVLKSITGIKGHVNNHRGVKLFRCPYCDNDGKTYVDLSAVRNHARTHHPGQTVNTRNSKIT